MPKDKRVATVKVEKKGPLKRGTRTAAQGGAAGAVVALIGTFVELNDWQVGLAVVALSAFFSWVQTTVEDYLGRGVLRDAPDVETVDGDPAGLVRRWPE